MTDIHPAGVVGARGHTGSELLRLLADHPSFDPVFAGSRDVAGEPVPGVDGLVFEAIRTDELAEREVAAVFLALPDGISEPYVESVPYETVIIDISADHRFDAAWEYGLPELRRAKIAGARRISNPGCYATPMQLALAPFVDDFDGVPVVFGVSGYSGAGAKPSPRNDPERLADNIVPYKLVGHKHERETTHHMGRPVRFMPHVHPAFRGLLVTVNIALRSPVTRSEVMERLEDAYGSEPLIELQDDIPELRDGTGRLGVLIGGVEVSADRHHAVIVAAEDNLLKGAAVQAVQNLNLSLGIPEFTGIL